MKKISILSASMLAALAVCGSASAQENLMPALPKVVQSRNFNPAYAPAKGGYFHLPIGVGIEVENTGFCLDDMFTKDANDSLKFDIDKLASNWDKDVNLTRLNIENPILGFGFTVGKNYFTFETTHRAVVHMALPKSLLDLRYGNWDYDGNRPRTISLSGLYMNMFNYVEIALGYSRQVNDKLRVGGAFKFLGGIFAAQTQDLNMKIETYEDDYRYKLAVETSGQINVSAPLDITYDEDGFVDEAEMEMDNFKMFKNNGFAVDLGATYKIMDNLTVGLSVLDLGFIKWKTNTNNFAPNHKFEFAGVNISENIKDEEFKQDDYWSQLEDSIMQFTDLHHSDGTFKTKLNSRIILTGQYDALSWLRGGVVLSSQIIDGRLYTRGSVNAITHTKSDNTAFIVSGTVNPGGRLSLGAGFQQTFPGVQLYLMADRIPFYLNRTTGASFKFGINFIIGQKNKPEIADNSADTGKKKKSKKGGVTIVEEGAGAM